MAKKLRGVWVFNEDLTAIGDIVQAINFVAVDSTEGTDFVGFCNSRNTSYMSLRYVLSFKEDGSITGYVAYTEGSGTPVWGAQGRTIDFGTTFQEVSEEFYNWFVSNAVCQSDTSVYDKASFLAGLAFGLCGRGVTE